MSTFSVLSLPQEQLDNLTALGYLTMTPVQMKALPPALLGQDMVVQAQTGSGKTVAFGLPSLARINPRDFGTQALILCPTRELAAQVATEIRRLARALPNIKVVVLCGGQPIGPQIGSLEHGAHVVVGTPGRIKDHLRKQTLTLPRLKTLVLDEADRMLDMGFSDDMADIIGQTPMDRQTLLFSATFPDDIASISAQYQRSPERITVSTQVAQTQIAQIFIRTQRQDKADTLMGLIQSYQPTAAVVFCQTKAAVHDLVVTLNERGVDAAGLHGDLEQRERDQVLLLFKQMSLRLLVATDVAARGLDIDSLPLVVNFDLPADPEVYVHRIGRTGRGSATGTAVSLFTDKETFRLPAIESRLSMMITPINPPAYQPGQSVLAPADFVTLEVSLGRKDKLRPGDLLGAITGSLGFAGNIVGKIDITDRASFVAIERGSAPDVLAALADGKVKGRHPRVRRLRAPRSR